MTTFKRGDRVRFIRDNTAGGANYGTKGDAGVIVSIHNSHYGRHTCDVKMDIKRCGFYPSAYCDDLELEYVELKYNPDQQPDEEDDI